jgi:hypothetical protein
MGTIELKFMALKMSSKPSIKTKNNKTLFIGLKIIAGIWILIAGIIGAWFYVQLQDVKSGKNLEINPKELAETSNIVASWNPQEACEYLSHISGFQTRGYINQYEDSFGCSSPYKDIGEGIPLANNIAYYVNGNSQNAKELKLVLNVNVTQNADEAHAVFLQYSEELTQKALGVAIPKDERDAILSGIAGEWIIKQTKVEIVREDWPTGKGYELKYILGEKL